MSPLDFNYRNRGLFFPHLNLWLDASKVVRTTALAVISHAHADHSAPHLHALCTPATRDLLRIRLPKQQPPQTLPFHRTIALTDIHPQPPPLASDVFLTLLPAGHVLGSAMVRLNTSNQSLLYTGDFNNRPGLSMEPCFPLNSDVLIMETTFGSPRYRFPPTHSVRTSILEFCRETLRNHQTPVLLAYSLGKAQEVLASLSGASLPIMLTKPVQALTRTYASLGISFPEYTDWNPKASAAHVVIAPPSLRRETLTTQLHQPRFALLSGWAMDPSCRFRSRVDAALPLSDHADFDGLNEFVDRVQAQKVYTLHGSAEAFARHLNQRGVDAQSLIASNQLELPFTTSTPPNRIRSSPSLQTTHSLPRHILNANTVTGSDTCE